MAFRVDSSRLPRTSSVVSSEIPRTELGAGGALAPGADRQIGFWIEGTVPLSSGGAMVAERGRLRPSLRPLSLAGDSHDEAGSSGGREIRPDRRKPTRGGLFCSVLGDAWGDFWEFPLASVFPRVLRAGGGFEDNKPKARRRSWFLLILASRSAR